MNTIGIDPFLYRTQESEIEKRWQNYPKTEKKDSTAPVNFEHLLRESLSQKTSMSLSSSTMSRRLTKDQIKEHIGQDEGRKKLYEAAEQFEAFFVEKMFREMKKNIHKSGLLNTNQAEEIFDDMLLTERVGQMAHNTDFGLAETIYRQMAQI